MRNPTADAIPLSRNYGTTTPADDQHGEHHPPPPPPPPKEGSCCHCCKDPKALPFCTLWIWLGFWQDLFSHPNSTKKNLESFETAIERHA
jgi:hypothetical protein